MSIMIKEVTREDKTSFNTITTHPLQSWEWGEFRIASGVQVVRLGLFDGKKLQEGIQFSIHKIPKTSYFIAYAPKCIEISPLLLDGMIKKAGSLRCIFIKLEPNVEKSFFRGLKLKETNNKIVTSLHPLFTPFSFILDLTPSETILLSHFHSKTRYNIKVAQKHNVTVQEDNSDEAFESYLALLFATTKRQKFYAHTPLYHKQMWEIMRRNNIAHLLTATYKKDGITHTLVTWILFLYHGVLYYPYGASSDKFHFTMASNLMMWETIRWGKTRGAQRLDMWGALAPNASVKDPWYGFHKFKQGYGGILIEFAGCYDIILNPKLYVLYNIAYSIRQFALKIMSAFNSYSFPK